MEKRTRTPISRSIFWSVIASYICAVGMMVASVMYAAYVDRQSNQKWCQLVVLLDSAYTQTPPTTDLGRMIARAMHQLKNDFDC